jgi:hypothetical protein
MDETNIRFYPIKPGDFDTGLCADGRQVVMGLLCPHLVAYFFDADGTLLGGERRLWNTAAERMSENGPYILHGEPFCSALERQKQEWKDVLGFRSATIRVKEFFDSEHFVGIEPLPARYQDLETSEESQDEEERRQLMQMRDSWLADGSFVWWWAEDYWMSKDGEVESN